MADQQYVEQRLDESLNTVVTSSVLNADGSVTSTKVTGQPGGLTTNVVDSYAAGSDEAKRLTPLILASTATPQVQTLGGQTNKSGVEVPLPPEITTTTGLQTATGGATTTGASNNPTGTAQATATNLDHRLRLSYLANAPATPVSGGPPSQYPGILAPLADTGGLLFPYTPAIQVSQDVDYASMQMTHSNMDYLAYSRTPNVSIALTAKFTVQNNREGLYAMAALHFLRAVSKMYFGEKDADAGLAGIPPPVLTLSGYGKYMFNSLRVMVKSHSYTFDENVQTVAVKIQNDFVRLPALFSLSITLVVQPTLRAMRKDFQLDEFRDGSLMQKAAGNNGWI